MTGCPICTRRDAKIHTPGDFQEVCCPRCGPYFLIGRVWRSLLQPRLEKEPDVPLARARVSHVIRSRTSDEQPLRIIDSGLEEIFSQPLPDPPKQVTNLIGYLKAQAGDAHLRTIDIKDRNALLGVVGAADESALEKLMQWASRKGLVSLSPDGNSVNLKPEAWED